MRRTDFLAAVVAMGALAIPGEMRAQQPAAAAQPPVVGNPVGLPVTTGSTSPFAAASPNVRVFGAIYSAESCSYDAARGVIVVPNRGVPQNVQANDAFVSFINHDGSVNTARWIGVQSPADRAKSAPPLVLNEPFGSDIVNGMLYVADRDGGTSPADTSVAVIRKFDLRTGAPDGSARIEGVSWINDIAVAGDGTAYATNSGDFGPNGNPASWQVWKVSPDGKSSLFVKGAPLFVPNGVAIDRGGNIVVVNTGDDAVLTFSPAGALLKTEHAAQPGSDGIVIMADGTKYVSSVRNGGISRIRPGRAAELIAKNIPSAASMCYDSGANQLVIPMNANNALAFISLRGKR